jgi:hypothetical protein
MLNPEMRYSDEHKKVKEEQLKFQFKRHFFPGR